MSHDNPEINTRRSGGGGTWAALLIATGVVLLLNNLGLLPWHIWRTLWQFWPLLLILGGVEIILGRSWISRLLVSLAGLAIAGLIIAFALAPTNPKIDRWLRKYLPQLPKDIRLQPEENFDDFTWFEISPQPSRQRIYRYY